MVQASSRRASAPAGASLPVSSAALQPSTRLRPSALAAYRARSARFINSSRPSGSPSQTASPRLTVSAICWPSKVAGQLVGEQRISAPVGGLALVADVAQHHAVGGIGRVGEGGIAVGQGRDQGAGPERTAVGAQAFALVQAPAIAVGFQQPVLHLFR